jgi:hypothetical protein
MADETGEAATIAAIDAILAPPQAEPKQNQAVEGEDAPAETETDAPAEADAPASEEEVESEKPATAEIPLEQLEAIELETTVQGVVEKRTIKELREGYMRQADYSKKTAEVARQREEVGEKVRQAIESERTQLATQLQQIQAVLIETVAPELKDVNWNHLAANEPAEYVRLRNRADQVSNVLKSVQAKQQELTQKQANEQRQAIAKAAQESRARLEAEIPGWNDELYQEHMKIGMEFGYSSGEVEQWLDPRTFKLLHEVREYRKLKAGKPPVASRVVAVPKVIKPGAAASNTQSQQRHADSMKKLQSSGNIQDAAAVIRARMGM